MIRLCHAIVLMAVFTLGCSSAGPHPSRASDEANVRVAMSGFMSALNDLDADRMAGYFAEDLTAFVPLAQADRVEGRAAVTQIFRNFVARTKPVTPRLNIIPEDLEVEVSGDLGFVSFNVRETSPPVTRRRTFIFSRNGDRWLIRHCHASDFFPAK